MRFIYRSGEAVKPGDRVLYHGESGHVDFVVTDKTGDPSRDWFLEKYPGGGFMIIAKGFGPVSWGTTT